MVFLLARPERLRILKVAMAVREGIRIPIIAIPSSLDRQLFNSPNDSDSSIHLERE